MNEQQQFLGKDNWLKQQTVIASATEGGEAISRETAFVSNNLNAYTTVAGQPYIYDANGNLTDDGENTYEYDYRNLLKRVARKSDGATVAFYNYDALGRRVEKIVEGMTTRFIYDGIHVIQEQIIGETVAKEFIYSDNIDEPIAMVTVGIPAEAGIQQVYYYHANVQGSVVALTDNTGAKVEEYTYTEYGEVEIHDAGGALLEQSGIGNPYFYTGQRLDPETQFYYYRARVYRPDIGRFLQRDPSGYVDGANLYAYTQNNPINWRDPLGLSKILQQNSWIGGLTGRPIEGAANLQVGNQWVDPTLGLFNDAVNVINNTGWSVLEGVGETVRAGEEFFGVTTDELFWASQSTPIPFDDAASGALVGLSRKGRTVSAGRAVSAVEAPITYTRAGERFIRVGENFKDLKFTFETPGGVAPRTYAFPEEAFSNIGRNPLRLKDLGDLPGNPPKVFRIIEPPPGNQFKEVRYRGDNMVVQAECLRYSSRRDFNMTLKLPNHFQDQLINAPEISYGANKIAVVLKDGRRFEDVIVAWGREIIKVGGSKKVPFDADDIASIEVKTE